MSRIRHLSRIVVALLVVLGTATTAHAQDTSWAKYVPKKKRVSLVRPFVEAAGMGAALSTGTVSAIIWLTDPTARAIVSEMIDDERLSKDEADARYLMLRPGGKYTILIMVQEVSTSPYVSATPILAPPFAENQTFLQRKDNKKIFSRGDVESDPVSINLNGKSVKGCFVVHFSTTDVEKTPIVGDPPGKLQVHYKLGTKQIVLELDPGSWIKKKLIASAVEL